EEQRTRQGAMRALPRAGGILGGCDEGAGRGRRFEGRRRGGALGERALGERALEQGTLREGALREGALGCGVLGQRALLGGVLWEARRGGTGRGVLGGGGAARGAIAACPRRLGSRGRSAGGSRDAPDPLGEQPRRRVSEGGEGEGELSDVLVAIVRIPPEAAGDDRV